MTPAFLATDFGGILPWTKHISALVLMAVCLSTLIARLVSIGCPSEARISPAAFGLSGLLMLLLIVAALQTVPLPQNWVAWLSPASYSAQVTWVGEMIAVDPGAKIPISIASSDSRHAIAYLAVATLIAFFSVLVFHHRDRTTWLLSAIAIGASSIAVIGLARKLIPQFQIWSFRIGGEGAPFGTFLNRNNAALGINLGIAASLGLIIWRMMASSPLEQSQEPTTRLGQKTRLGLGEKPSLDWLREPVVLLALTSICICLVGLIACGSRGGLLSMVVASVVTFAIARRQMGRLGGILGKVLGATAVIAIIIFVVLRTDTLGNQALREGTITQIGSTIHSSSNRLKTDTRLKHWPDGFRTALQHFPSGSGLASYGYAYLPWQQTSPWRLCVHADNLWLEMFVELGIAGLILASVCGWIIIRCLAKLNGSPDPIDQGLRIVGCYAAVMILVSQMFDFGLILPANLIATVLLFSVIVARASTVIVAAKPASASKPKLVLQQQGQCWWKSPRFLRETLFQTTAAITLLLVALGAIQRLRLDSEVDTLARAVDSQIQVHRIDLQRLGEIAAQCQQLADHHPHPDLFAALVKLQFQRGRLMELASMNVGRMPDHQQQQMYSATSFSHRRLGWRSSQQDLAGSVTDAGQSVTPLPLAEQFRIKESPYVDALKYSESLLRLRPLGLAPRTDQVYLEFIHRSLARTRIALRQSARLFRNNPELQLRFGAAAADNGDYDLAVQTWHRAATLRPTMIKRVLGRAIRFPDFPVADLIPESAAARETASEFFESMNVVFPLPNQAS